MKEILEILNRQAGDYVIVGSLALYLHGEIENYDGKDIDIIVDRDINAFDHLDDWKPQYSRFNDKRGWVTNIAHLWIEVFNCELPEYEEFEIEGINVKVITLEALKKHYRSLDLNKIGGHQKFQNKLRTYIEMSS